MTTWYLPPLRHQGSKRGGRSPSPACVAKLWLAQGLGTLAVPILSPQLLDGTLVGVEEKAPRQLGSVSLAETRSLLAKEFWG